MPWEAIRPPRATRRRWRGLAVALLTTGLAQAAPEATATTVGSFTAAEAESLARDLAPEVERLRGRKFLRPVPVRIIDDAAARRHFQARVARFWPEERLRSEAGAYGDLGLLPEGVDLLRLLLDIIEEQAGGFYDPDSDTFFLLGDMPRSIAPILMIHELTHALDDQHFGIDTMLGEARANQDREAALAALVEGSGTLVMSVYLAGEIAAGRLDLQALQAFQESEAGRADRLLAAPELIRRSLLGSYLLGQTFLLRGNPLGLAAGVKSTDLDRAFQGPPESSEQILHPEKYWDADRLDPPRPVSFPDLAGLLGKGWTRAGEGTLGEMVLAILAGARPIRVITTDLMLADRWTTAAAAGWGGDRWHHYVSAEGSATVLATVWDSESDAEEFATAVGGDPKRAWMRRRDAVVVVAGAPADRADALARAALDAVAPGR